MPITRARPPHRKKPAPAKVVVSGSHRLPAEQRGRTAEMLSALCLSPAAPGSVIVTARSPAEIKRARRIEKLRRETGG